jgi:hypothetical protein
MGTDRNFTTYSWAGGPPNTHGPSRRIAKMAALAAVVDRPKER